MEDNATPTSAGLHATLQGFAGRRVLVLGDMLADEYIIGRPSRLSREAPIPVLEWVDRYIVPGGATNLARNCRALGATVAVCGVIGDDEPGRALAACLADEGIATTGLVSEAGRPTATATRVIGGGPQIVSQQIARIDRVVREPIATETQARFVGITIATPNQDEAAASLGRPLRTDDDLCRAGRDLARQMDAQGVLITRGSEGDGACRARWRLPASARRAQRSARCDWRGRHRFRRDDPRPRCRCRASGCRATQQSRRRDSGASSRRGDCDTGRVGEDDRHGDRRLILLRLRCILPRPAICQRVPPGVGPSRLTV